MDGGTVAGVGIAVSPPPQATSAVGTQTRIARTLRGKSKKFIGVPVPVTLIRPKAADSRERPGV
jgi:hypothetical protein